MRRLTVIYLFLFVYLFSGCTGSKRDDYTIRVSVLRGPSAIAFAGWMERPMQWQGKQLVVDVYDSPEQIQAAMIKGESDMAALPMVNAANLYTKNIPYVLAGCPVWGSLFIVGRQPVTRLSVFGTGTTPDILTRYYLEETGKEWALDYSLSTPVEVMQGMLMGKVGAAVLNEPFASMVMQRDSTVQMLADLNHPSGDTGHGFAQTAVMMRTSLSVERAVIDSLLTATCRYVNEQPEEVIRILEARRLFAPGMLTPAGLHRLRIHYVPAVDAAVEIRSFLEIIYHNEPKAIGGRMPDEGFITGKP